MAIPVYRPYLEKKEADKLKSVLESGWISAEGEELEKFETALRDFLSVKHGLATDSGTSALHSALEAIGVKGKEVIIPGLTFGATALAVKQAGGIPVPVDIESKKHGIDPEKLKEAINPETTAVVVVHLFGEIGELNRIKEIAELNDLKIIEDAAQAFGTSHRGQKVGTIGDIGIFSFSWNKTITTGKGGFVATNKDDIAKKIRSIVCNGEKDDEKFKEMGYNFHMDSVRASIGNCQLKKYEEISQKKSRIFDLYYERLSTCKDIQSLKPEEAIEPWAYYIKTAKREKVVEELEKSNISTRRFYPPVNELGAVQSENSLPVSNKTSNRGLMLPSYPGLELNQASRITQKIKAAID